MIELNVTAVAEGVRTLEEVVGRTNETITNFGQWEGIPSLELARGEIQQTIDTLRHYREEAAELEAYLPQERPRRGIFNGGGSILKAIFGNPDADDWEAVQKGIAARDRDQGTLVHASRENILYSRSLGRKLEEQGKQLENLAREAEVAAATLTDLAHQWHDTTLRMEQITNATTWINYALRGIAVKTIQAGQTLRDTRRAIEEGARGVVSSLLISPTHLGNLIGQIQKGLPEGVGMLAGGGVASAHTHYQSAEVHGWITDHTLHLSLAFPLVRESSQFTIYEVTSVPIPERQSGRHLQLDLTNTHFLIRHDQEFYAELGERSLKNCKRTPKLVCQPGFPLRHRSEASCTLALFLGETPASQACEWHILTEDPEEEWIWVNEKTGWHYTLASTTRVAQHCPGQAPTEQELEGSGVLLPRPYCSVRTPGHLLLPGAQGTTHHNWTIPIAVPQSWSPTLLKESHPGVNLTGLQIAVDSLRAQGKAVRTTGKAEKVRLEDALQELNTIQASYPWMNTLPIWGGISLTGIAGLVGVIGLLVWIYRRGRRGTTPRNPNPQVVITTGRELTPLVVHRPKRRAPATPSLEEGV